MLNQYWRAQLASLAANIGVLAAGVVADYLVRVAGKPGIAESVALAATIVALYLRSLVTKKHVTAPAVTPRSP